MRHIRLGVRRQLLLPLSVPRTRQISVKIFWDVNVKVKAAVLLQERRLDDYLQVAVWRSGSALVLINEVNLRRARLVRGWVTTDRVWVRFPGTSLYFGM